MVGASWWSAPMLQVRGDAREVGVQRGGEGEACWGLSATVEVMWVKD